MWSRRLYRLAPRTNSFTSRIIGYAYEMPGARDQNLSGSITTLAAILNEAIAARLEDTLRKEGLTLGAFELLSAVKGSPQSTQAELAANLGITPSSFCEAVRSASSKGLVGQEVSTSDRRVRQVVLTRRGIKVLDDCLAALRQAENEAVQGISESRLSTAIEVLRQATKNLSG